MKPTHQDVAVRGHHHDDHPLVRLVENKERYTRMCEPHHSIVQYDDPNAPRDDDFGGSAQSVSKEGLHTKLGRWAKKVKGWLHFSKMGKGHSEGVASTNRTATRTGLSLSELWRFSDHSTNYEAAWWDRSFSIDGRFHGPHFDRSEATDAAHEYANAVSIGSLSALRRFLETTLLSTETMKLPGYYRALLEGFLNKKGRDQFLAAVPAIAGPVDLTNYCHIGRLSDEVKNRLMKLTLGYTRKRKLIVPEWADDSSLWTKGKSKLVVPGA